MSSHPIPKVYFDASTFLAFFAEEKDRWDTVLKVLEDALTGKIELYTSQAAITECPLFHKPVLLDAGGRDIIELFFDNAYIRKVQVDRWVAYKSRELQRASKLLNPRFPTLAPMDAVHMATAMLQDVDYLFTYDSKHLTRYDKHALVNGLPICEVYRPWETQMTIDDIIGTDHERIAVRMRSVGLGLPAGVEATTT